MGDVYASTADRVNDTIRELNTKDFDSVEDLAQTYNSGILEKGQQKIDAFTQKWSDVENLGEKDIIAVTGLGGIYHGARKIYDKYKSLKSKNDLENAPEDLEDMDEEKDTDGVQPSEVDEETPAQPKESIPENVEPSDVVNQPVKSSVSSQWDNLTTDEQNELKGYSRMDPDEMTDEQSDRMMELSDKFDQPLKTTDSTEPQTAELNSSSPETQDDLKDSTQQGAGENTIEGSEDTTQDIVGDAVEGLGEEGSEATTGILSGLVSGLEASDVIPVIGEATAILGGLVAVGEGIYHLFHKPKAPQVQAPDPTISNINLASQLTTKYSNAVPTMDSLDKPGALTSF